MTRDELITKLIKAVHDEVLYRMDERNQRVRDEVGKLIWNYETDRE